MTLSRPVSITTHDGVIAPQLEPTTTPVATQVPSVNWAAPSAPAANRPIVRLRAWFAGRSRKATRTLGYGRSTELAGQLTTADGKPVGGASLEVQERVVGVASRVAPAATVRTDAKGGFVYEVEPGPTRTIVVGYRVLPSDPAPSVVAEATVYTHAGVTLRTSPAHVRNGTTMTFSGRVLAERTSRRALVTIYSVAGAGPRKRIPVETVRADSSGRFRYRYTFHYLEGPTTYRFVAVVPKQIGFPYLEGASKTATVRGRP
jgi:hypothetical protein